MICDAWLSMLPISSISGHLRHLQYLMAYSPRGPLDLWALGRPQVGYKRNAPRRSTQIQLAGWFYFVLFFIFFKFSWHSICSVFTSPSACPVQSERRWVPDGMVCNVPANRALDLVSMLSRTPTFSFFRYSTTSSYRRFGFFLPAFSSSLGDGQEGWAWKTWHHLYSLYPCLSVAPPRIVT